MRTLGNGSGAEAIAPPAAQALRDRIFALTDLPIAELRAAWSSAWGAPPPKGARRRLMMLGIAWRWQANAQDGFRPETARRLAALKKAARRDSGVADAYVAEAARPRPGARLLRDWRGARHEVHVTHTGYLWRGREFGSLSSVARAITGVNRNGPAFFGLRSAGEGH
jgi:hypothetical protein